MRVRLMILAAAATLAVVVTAAMPVPMAGASCSEPTLTVSPDHGKPDDPFQVSGKQFMSGCAASGASQTPNADIKIFFTQGGKEWLIGTVAQAGADGSFTGTVYVPNGDGKNESPYGQAPSQGAATVRAEGTDGKPTAAFTVDPGPTAGKTTTTKGATTTTAAGGVTTTLKATTTTKSSTTTTTEAPDVTTTITSSTASVPPVITVEPSTSSTEVAGAPLSKDDNNSGPLIAVALVLLAALGVTLVWRAVYRGPNSTAGDPWDAR